MSEPSNNQHENAERQANQQAHGEVPQGHGSSQQSPGGQPPKKSKKKWFIGCGIALLAGLIILIVVIVLIVQGLGGSDDTAGGTEAADSSVSTAASSASGKPVAVNQVAKVGKFDVKVLNTSKAKTVGEDVLKENATGEFLIVELQVKNNDSAAGYFGDDAVKAITAEGDQIEASLEASSTIDSSLSTQEINPGKRVTGKMVFDIPKGQQAKTLEISDPDLLGDEIRKFAIK